MCCVFVSPVEDGSVCWEGPTNVLALSSFICPPVSLFVQRVSRWAFILMKIVRRPWSILSRRSCTMSLIMSASGFPCIEGDFPSPVHFWEEERKQAESDRRITGFLFYCLLESSSARHAAPNSALFDEFPSTPRPSWQHRSGTEAGLLGIYNFPGSVYATDGSNDRGSWELASSNWTNIGVAAAN